MRVNPEVVASAQAVAELCDRLGKSKLLATDLESNGLFAYTAGLCTLQILEVESHETAIVDPLKLEDSALAPLAQLLGERGPRKLVHDVAFDARILAQHGISLGNVFDTALAARFLGAPATGLSALAESRLGQKLSKKMQQHDWGKRPLTRDALQYLVGDVQVLPPIAAQLDAEIAKKDLAPELEEETRYRLATAREGAACGDPRPAYVRIRDAGKLKPTELAILRELANVREMEARRLDVPPFKVLDNAVLLALCKNPPATREAFESMRGVQHARARALHAALWEALGRGMAAKEIPADERTQFFTPPPGLSRAETLAIRQRTQRLTAWRKSEAARRGIDEQAALPGHVMHDLAARAPSTLEALEQIPGLGAFRAARDGEEILQAIAGQGGPRVPAGHHAKSSE